MQLTQSVHRLVQRDPDNVMTIYGDRQRSAREFADRIARLAGALRSLGVASGDRVGILSMNSDRYLEYYFAVPWADAVTNSVNIRWSAPEIAYSLKDCDTRVLLVDDTFAPLVPALREQFDGLTTVIYCGDATAPDGMLDYEALVAGAMPIEDAERGGKQLAAVFYTGGTTGFPKGVMLSHDNLVVSAMGCLASESFVTTGGRYLHAAPMFHLADVAGMNAAMLAGAAHVIVPSFTAVGVLDAIARHQVTDTLIVPTMIQMLVDHPDAANTDLSSVRHVLYGASPISEAVLERASKAFPTADFVQAYGMTELSPVATLLSAADHHVPRLRRAAGRPAVHAKVRIVDEYDNEVPRGTVGEIAVAGDHVMLGYWDKPEETAAALRGGWMHTGDGGFMDEQGYVFVVDRIKDMIVTGGENVYSVEVENAVTKHPAVAACAVIGIPDEKYGELVHAVVVLHDGASVEPTELTDFCRAAIANYKVPRSFAFVEALPVSGAGKVLKRELRQMHWGDNERAVN